VKDHSIAQIKSPFPREVDFAFYRRVDSELWIFLDFHGVVRPYTLSGLALLIRSTTDNVQMARYLYKIYRQMSLIDPDVLIEALLPTDFTAQLYKQSSLNLALPQTKPVAKPHTRSRSSRAHRNIQS
jgi:hypothetical protein